MSDKPPRGFARLTPEQRRALSRQGGKAAQAAGTAHRWDSTQARENGRRASAKRQLTTEDYRAMGKKGAAKRWGNRANQ